MNVLTMSARNTGRSVDEHSKAQAIPQGSSREPSARRVDAARSADEGEEHHADKLGRDAVRLDVPCSTKAVNTWVTQKGQIKSQARK
jgi:hypothetical protein